MTFRKLQAARLFAEIGFSLVPRFETPIHQQNERIQRNTYRKPSCRVGIT
jgi:hypothetical protein